MDTRNTKKSTEVVTKSGDAGTRPTPTDGAEGTEVPTPTHHQNRSEEWRFLCLEFDDNLNMAVNSLAIGRKTTAPQLCIYFEKIISIMRTWLTSHEAETQDWERPLQREFLWYATYAATILKPKLNALKSKGISEEVLLTAVDYRSYANIERSALEDRSSYARRSNSEASGSVKSALSRPPSIRSRTSINQPTHAQRRETNANRRSRRGRNAPIRNDFTAPYDCETPELLRELRRYAELPQPWNKMPTQSVRLERLDVSRQVQLAGERSFKGDIDDYVKWRDFFIGTIGDVRCHARHKVNALRKSLDSVLETVIDFIPGDFNGYKQIVENLEKAYGGTFRQMSRYDDYFDSAQFKYGVLDGFREYIRKVAGYKALLAASGDAAFFGTPHIYRRMLLPLPSGHVRELQTWLHTERMEPSASNLLLWGQDRLDRLMTEKEVERRKDKTGNTIQNREKTKTKVMLAQAQWSSESEPEECLSEVETTTTDVDQNVMIHYLAQRPPEFCLLTCSEKHALSDCPRFAAMDPNRRRAHIRCWKMLTCFSCLNFGHSAKNCRNAKTCEVCKSKAHHTLLHRDSEKVTYSNYHVSLLTTAAIIPGRLPYLTVKISKCSNERIFLHVNAIIDTGSNVTIASKRIRDALDKRDAFQQMFINTAGGSVSKKAAIVQFILWTRKDEPVNISALSFETDEMFNHMEAWNVANVIEQNPYLKKAKVRNPPSKEIDLLIGNDYPGLTAPQEVIKGPTNTHPVAEKSALGWSLRGSDRSTTTLHVDYTNENEDTLAEITNLLRQIERSWELADKLPYEYMSPSDKIAEKIIQQTMKLKEGFVEAGVLWKESHPPNVINNRPLALKRLFALWKSLEKNREVKKLYSEVIEQWVQDGTLTPVTERVAEGKVNYLSHFPVVRMTKATTKVRIVVDAAARFRGTCLNDFIMPGPNLTNDVRRVLLRFRHKPIAILGDVRSMFTRIKLLKDERSYHRILWGTNDDNIKEYEFTCFTFGNTCSPSVAMSTARYLTTFFPDSYDRAKDAMLKSTIVDDTLDSVDSEEEAVKLIKEIQEIYAKGSMELRKIGSNSLSVMREFTPEELSTEILLAFESTETSTSAKTLGVAWSPNSDQLVYNLALEPKLSSRRELLSQLARVYDPLGLISPLLMSLKIIVQSTWQEKNSWDAKLSSETLKRWSDTLNNINGRISFNRKLTVTPQLKIARRTIHIFVDASNEAIGAVAYMVVRYDTGERTSNIMLASSRVAPLKFTTIPRLELQAAIEGINLAEHIVQALNINPYDIRYWSDSTDVLHWLNSTSRSLKVFVATRVAQIQRKSRIDLWNWVPTNYNPADLISRGTTILKLDSSSLWKDGPVFLRDESQLPTPKNSGITPLAAKESKTKKKITIKTVITINQYWNEKLKRFSSWKKFLRAIFNIIKRTQRNASIQAIASQALFRIVSLLQQELIHDIFQQLKNGKALQTTHIYAKYRLFYNNDTKAIHASGRLSHTEHLPTLTRFPLFIPEKTYLATLIIRHFHSEEQLHMGGIRSLIAQINTTFAIPYLTMQTKRITRACVYCKRLSFRTGCPTQAPLPYFRQPQQMRHEIYETAAMDCLGPLYAEKGKKKQEKVYVLVITCVFYRAIHLELIHTLSSDSFLLAFERFISVRNRPKQVISDNGRNFLGTWNVLEKVFRDLPERLVKYTPI